MELDDELEVSPVDLFPKEQEALDQIYPHTGQYRIEIPGWEDCYARIGPPLKAAPPQRFHS